MSQKLFGEILKDYREEHNMSQQDLAVILGTTKQVISRYETGQREPKITIAKEYSEKLGLPLPYLLGDVSNSDNEVSNLLDLSDFECEVIRMIRLLSEDQQQAFLGFLKSLLNTQKP